MTISLEDLWAPFGLTVRAGPLTLRALTDQDLPMLADLALSGIHEPDRMPFAFPWTDVPAAELPRNLAAFHWGTRANFAPAAWNLELGVWHGDTLIGVQAFHTQNYLVTKSGETGSWLGLAFQGQRWGTLMRQAMCVLLFDHLDAAEITSAAFIDNPASLAVSHKIGYVDNGQERVQRRPGELAILQRLLLTPDRLVRPDVPIEVDGAQPLRRAIGLDH